MDQNDDSLNTNEQLNTRFTPAQTTSLFAVLSRLFDKRHKDMKDPTHIFDAFQQLFARLRRTRSSVILDEFVVSQLLFSIGHVFLLESTAAAFCASNVKILSWNDVLLESIVE